MVLKLIYTVFIGILLALFVGLGIEAFYPSPKYPVLQDSYQKMAPGESNSAEVQKIEAENKKLQDDYQAQVAVYTRNLFMIVVFFAVIFLATGLLYADRIEVIADGLLLGGVFTLIYGIARGMQNQDSKFRFLAVTVGLLIALGLGYIKFIKPIETKTKSAH